MTNDKKQPEVLAIEDGMMLDYLTNNPIKETPKELVRQKTLRALFHEYGISAEDMALDFKTIVGGKNKKIDIAIFEHGAEHVSANIRRIVICDTEPKKGKKSAVKMRDHDQAQKDLQLMEDMMREQVDNKYVLEKCQWGLWTNGIEFFFVEKEESRFDTKFNAVGDWPLADETMGSRDVASNAQLRTADREMLLTAFPVELIQLSSQIILHKFNAPDWLKHIQKACIGLKSLTPEKLGALKPGEAYIWSSKASDSAFVSEAMKIQCRPRVTKHGGDTLTAV